VANEWARMAGRLVAGTLDAGKAARRLAAVSDVSADDTPITMAEFEALLESEVGPLGIRASDSPLTRGVACQRIYEFVKERS